ncbi:PA14 domain-containing protein, partial [Bacillus kexueae]|uniref:PA14 domain-containing protein n=1 Tax=Aeribacillus kexueae TaxID=2078952 RepID=UPI001FAFC9E9
MYLKKLNIIAFIVTLTTFVLGNADISLANSNLYLEKSRNVHYNWGYGSPSPSIPNDNFTAIFDQSGTYNAGDYFVQTLADDGVKVEVDGKWLIDRWSPSSGTINRALWLNVQEGTHTVKTHYYEGSGRAVLFSDIVPFDHWIAYYYPNKDVKGQPTAAKVIAPEGELKRLREDHGRNSPANGVPVDNFSAKYTTAKRLEAGEYIIRTRADDGIKVYIDGQLVLNRWSPSDSSREDAVKVKVEDRSNVPAAEKNVHWIEVEYYDGLYNSNIEFSIEPYKVVDTGWIGELYSNTSLSGVPVILGGENALEPIQNLNFDWGWGAPHPLISKDNFTARFLREIDFETGFYTFEVKVDDGVRLWVDDKLVIDSWGPNDGQTRTGKVLIDQGRHQVKVEVLELTQRSKISLNYFRDENKSYVRKEQRVHYNWGYNAPSSSITPDYFTAIFDQSGTYNAGDYFVQTLADDGVKVEVDGKWLIDRWSPSSGTINRALWLNVQEGTHTVKTHYYEGSGRAVLFSDIVPFDHWIAYYYPNKDVKGQPTAAKVIAPEGELKRLREDHGRNSPANGVPVDNFSAKYTTAKRLEAGEYIIRTRADDGIKVYIDGQLVLNRWSPSDSSREDAVKVKVEDRSNVPAAEKNVHWIEVEYYDGLYNSNIEFSIEPYKV